MALARPAFTKSVKSIAESTGPAVGAGLTPRGRTIALWVVLLAFFMDVLDGMIVNVAIPSI